MAISKEDFKIFQLNISDEVLDFIINLTSRKIKNFCYIDTIPEELKETQIQMCVDVIKLCYSNNSNSSDDSSVENANKNGREVKNIKRGDTQIEFSSNIESKQKEQEFLANLINSDNFLFSYENELLDFRKLRWD